MALEQLYTQTIELIESASDCTATITPSIEGKDKVSIDVRTLGWAGEIGANLNTKRTETTIFTEGEE